MAFSATTTVLAAAANQDLTDLATARDELGIGGSADTSNDPWLRRVITAVSSAVANETQRVFAPELVLDSFDIERDVYPFQTPGGFAQLQLARWPVLDVVSVVQTISHGSTQTLVEGKDFWIDKAAGQLLRLNPFTGVVSVWEAQPVAVTYVGGLGAMASEAHAVPASAPYQVTVTQSAAFSCDEAVADASGTILDRVSGTPGAGQYSVAAGVYLFNAADASKSLTFAYGVKVIPDDLVDICLRLITARYSAKGRDPALVQRETPGIGLERWWFGGAPGQKGQFPPDIEAALENYSMPILA